ncbi:MAG: NUDIX domain-containing protein [Flavobacteriales bacterium]|nr:NUDIX domain-containing protein [Flavobacteriales bacterium]
MYKVFFNEGQIIISDKEIKNAENIYYNSDSILDLLLILIDGINPETKINLYSENVELLWEKFCSKFNIIYAAGGVVKNKDNQILFIHRLGKWDLPKGKVEKGEEYESAGIREVEEECGITNVEILNFRKNTYHLYFQNNVYNLKITYWYDMIYDGNEKLIPQIEENIDKVEWKDETESQKAINQSYSNIKELFA